jgi:hypothetical protein
MVVSGEVAIYAGRQFLVEDKLVVGQNTHAGGCGSGNREIERFGCGGSG